MSLGSTSRRDQVERDGFVVARAACTEEALGRLDRELAQSLERASHLVLRGRAGVYGARHVHTVCAAAREAAWLEGIRELATEILGEPWGMVRSLYFDKTADGSWALPWHRDRTIAVRPPPIDADVERPTMLGGIPHVSAPDALLTRMLTVRIHLDDADRERGALEVVPGSHGGSSADMTNAEGRIVEVRRGDVLAMRPLLAHRSGPSRAEGGAHRRVLHLELAADESIEPLEWHDFVRRGA